MTTGTITNPSDLVEHTTGTATPKQRSFLIKLLGTRDYEPSWADSLAAHMTQHGLSKAKVSSAIDHLVKLPMRDGTDPNAATPSQRATIERMLTEREVGAGWAEQVRKRLGENPTKADASAIMDVLLLLPYKPETTAVEDGRYALGTVDNPMRYRVRTHNGRVYVDHIGANEATTRVKGEQKTNILADIAKDLEAATALYGKVTGRCGICHRMLTNQASVDRGIGPDCAKDRGW